MSNTFIGLTMLVTLSSPPGAQLRGIVSGIEPGKSLTLRNVTCPANGKYVSEFTIKAAEIVELVEAVNENIPRNHNPPPLAIPVPKTTSFEDPAIVSVGKRPTPVSRPSVPGPGQWHSTSMDRQDSARTATGREIRPVRDTAQEVPLVDSMQQANLSDQARSPSPEGLIAEELEVETLVEQQAPKTRRPRRRKGRRANDDPSQDATATPAKETTRSKGWRQTPLLEPNPSFQPFATLKKHNGRKNGKLEENGWATEDATDVQDMGDFDFAGSLAKFDKRSVFTQIQAEDSVAEEDRLVFHNRLPKAKPGTAGGKNLHYTENVLEVPGNRGRKDLWKSEAGESEQEERSSQKGSGSGRLSRRGESKISTGRRPVSRKGSSIVPPPRAHSNPTSPSSSFFLVPSDRRCETISALQMLNLENIADNELGLSGDMMAENAGRGIAEVALSALNASGRGLIQGKSTNIPTVVVLAGNNKSGLRAVASGRHIRNHGLNVVVCVLGLERDSELLDGLKRQIKVFRSFGGKIVTKVELLEYVKTLDSPIELIVDGLLGLTITFEELRTGDQATAYELIEWANRSRASVLAIDIPTGIDPTTGKVSIIDGRRLYIHSKFVVAMGAPKKGLLEAMILGEGIVGEDGVGKGKEWQLFVVDLGLGAAVWKKSGTRLRKGVEFEGSWVLGMRFQGAAE